MSGWPIRLRERTLEYRGPARWEIPDETPVQNPPNPQHRCLGIR